MNLKQTARRPALSKILSLEDAYQVIENRKSHGAHVVFTNGCFDLLHPGHTRYLAEARRLGDLLIVAINSDRSVRALKGEGRPIMPQEERAEVLAALESVDYVTVFDDPTPEPLLARILPDVLAKGAGLALNEIVGWKIVKDAGGRVVSMASVPGFSTTAIVQAVKGIYG